MSLKAYLDNIEAKTGKTPQQFVDLARSEGLIGPGVKPGQIVSWLKAEHGLGHGHAMAIVATIKQTTQPPTSDNQKIAKHFSGKKATWRPTYDKIASKVSSFGSDTDVQAGTSYISLRRNGKKFAIVQVTNDRMDVGVKLKGTSAQGRLESAGSWNAMVTHRVRIHSPKDVNQEFYAWLKSAYEEIGLK
jgi:hypothetical protein